MKRIRKYRKEHGAITLMTAFMLVVLLGFTALVADFGLRYVEGAKLQNAIDAAATAAASSIGDVDESIENTAYQYLALNGFDRDGDYKDKIDLDIETKGVVNLKTTDDESYITAGFYKLTVTVEQNTLFASVLGVDSMKLQKTSYVRCKPNYVDMPKALNYTIFAGSTEGTENNPAIKVDGRTADWVNNTANFFERAINWTNSTIVQPIIGWFGGNPNYNELVHINLSEIVCNGDVHSNSNIRIGVQALNVSRVKDRDYEGINSAETNYGNGETATTSVDTKEINGGHDYGQVTFTAVDRIMFNNSLKNNHPSSTHVYVQNQQYLEATQDLLDVLDEIDYTKCKDTATLRQQFRAVLQTTADPEDPEFLKTFWGRHTEIYRSEKRKQALLAQVDLIEYDPTSSNIYINYTGGRALLQSQNQIVYNVSQKAIDSEESGALGILQQFRQTADAYKNGTLTVENDFDKELSPQQKALLNWRNEASGDDKIDPIYKDSSDELMYANQADKKSDIDYDVLFSRTRTDALGANVLGDDGLPIIDNLELTVQGTSVARNFTHLGNFTGNEDYEKAKEKTTNGVKFAVANTFQENSDYISMPNLKPYFTRQINQSVRNATKTKEESGSSTAGDRNIKQAVDTKGKEYQDIIKKAKIETGTKDENGNDEYSYRDKKYENADNYNKKDSTLLFTRYKNKDGGLTNYYSLDENGNRVYDNRHTTFSNMGETLNIYDGNSLKAPVGFVEDEYNAKMSTENASHESDFGKGAINRFYNDVVSVNYFSNDNTGATDSTGMNVVREKKKSIRTEQINKVKELHDTILRAKDGSTQSPYVKADNSIETNNESSEYGYAVMQAAAKRHIELEEKPDITQGEAQGDVEQLIFVNNAKNAAYNIPNHTVPGTSSMNFQNLVPANNKEYSQLNYSNVVNAKNFVDRIVNQNNWSDEEWWYDKNKKHTNKLVRCKWDEGKNDHDFHRVVFENEEKKETWSVFWSASYYGTAADQVYQLTSYSGRGFIVSSGQKVWIKNYLRTGDDSKESLSVRGVLAVSGNATTTDGCAVYSVKDIQVGKFADDSMGKVDNSFMAVNGSVKANGQFYMGENAFAIIQGDLTTNALELASGAVLIVNGNINTNSNTLTNKGTIICSGNLSTGNAALSGEGITYVGGSVNSGSSEYNISGRHKLYCEDTITVSDMSLNNSFVHAGNEFKTTNTSGQSLSLTNSSVLESLDKFEVIDYYVSGNSTLNVKVIVGFGENKEVKYRNKQNYVFDGDQKAKLVDLGNCEIKINGDLTVTEGITLSGGTKLYVTGAVYCGGAITLSGGSGLYADRGVGVKTKDESADSKKVPISITLTGGSVLLCRNDINATTLKDFVISTLTAIGNWLNIYRANITCNGPISAEGGSKVYAEGRINTYATVAKGSSHIAGFYAINLNRDSSDGGKVEVDGKDSFVFCGEKSSTSNKPSLTANGQFYYPKSNISLTHLEVKMYGYAVMRGNVTISGTSNKDGSDFQISKTGSNAGTLYVDGVTKFENCFINNGGNMYLVGGVDYQNAYKRGRTVFNNPTLPTDKADICNYCDATFASGSVSYIGHEINGNGTFTFSSQYEARGDVYFEDSLSVNGSIPKSAKYTIKVLGISTNIDTTEYDSQKAQVDFPNRGVTIYIPSGTTYVSGSVSTCYDNAIYIKGKTNTGLIIKDNLTMGCSIYNYGQLIIGKRFNLNNEATYITDKGDNKYNQGISLKNGEGENDINATFYVGATNNPITFIGYVRNAGNVYINSALRVQGWSSSDAAGDFAYVNYANAKTHINGYLQLCSNQLLNKGGSELGVSGRFTYGSCAYNCGKMYVDGDITNDETDDETCNSKSYRGDKSASFYNGLFKIDESVVNGSYRYRDAVVFCNGKMQFGYKVNENGPAGSMINIGKAYVHDDLNIYTYDAVGLGVISTRNSYYYTAYYAYNDSRTIVGGNFYGGSGVGIGNGSIFMCGGDYKCSRAAKIGANVRFRIAGMDVWGWNVGGIADTPVIDYSDDDLYSQTYFYCGGNCLVNTFGRTNYEWSSNVIGVPENASRDCDIYSNTNMYIGGSFFANSCVFMKQNVTMQVAGNKSLHNGSNVIEDLFESFTNEDSETNITNIFKDIWNGALNKEPYKCFIYQSLDQNICSRMTINGSMYVQDTCKMRDMVQNYVYGDFRCKDYFELGKALDGNDETEAKEEAFRTPEEELYISKNSLNEYNNTYKFVNSAYMFVDGNFESGGQFNFFQNLFAHSYTKIYASSTLRANGNVVSNKYITLRHDARLIANGKVTAINDIDGGSYCAIICSGDLKTTLGKMKIRDQVTVAVGGNCTALQYIELGKSGDFVRTDHTINKVDALEGGDAKYDGNKVTNPDEEIVSGGTDNGGTISGEEGEQSGTTEQGDSTQTGEGGLEYGTTLDTTNELTADKSDAALGGEFYIAGSLITYTGYIKEFAYSFVSVGGVVFTPKYVTLRHNSDMWILPELYKLYGDKDNKTYQYTPYIPTSDGSIWGDIKDFFGKIGHEVKENFSPHDGTLYTMGELTLNKNASLLGTYDAQVLGQCVLREDSLVYLGHDFNCNAPSVNISLDMIRGNTSVVGFDSYGKAGVGWKYTCKNYEKHDGYYYTMTVREADKPKSGYVKCDVCGNLIPASEAVKTQVSYPAVVYAYNNIDIDTTIQMRLTYLVANKGDVSMYNVYTKTENAEKNAKELPNAICSYLGHINYFGMYSKLGALFYAPTKSTKENVSWFESFKPENEQKKTKVDSITLDGYYNEIWGCIMGDTIDMSSYYLTLHRFENWRTMDLHVVESGNVFIIPQKKYDEAAPNVDDIYLNEKYRVDNTEIESEGARQFFIPGEYIPHSVTNH